MVLPGDPEEFVVKPVYFTARRGGDLSKEAGGWGNRLRGRGKKGRRRKREGFSVEKTFDLKPEAAQSSELRLSLQFGGYVVQENPSRGTMDFSLPGLLFHLFFSLFRLLPVGI